MADGPTSGPDLMSLIRASMPQGGSGNAPILMGARLEVNVGSGLSCQGKGLNADGMVNKLPQGRPGMLAKLLKDMGVNGADIMAGMQKVAQAGPVQQCSPDAIFGNAQSGLGGGFAGMVSAAPSTGGAELG